LKPESLDCGPVLAELARVSSREMNAHRMQHEREQFTRGIYKKCPPGWMTRREISEALGIPLRNLTYYIQSGKLPFKRIDRNIFFEPNETEKAYKALNHKRGRKS
jgi:hypothetical protein